MKKYIHSFFVDSRLFLFAGAAHTQDAKLNLRNFEPRLRKASFIVHGACTVCKTRIEAALKVDGIKNARWDMQSKMLNVQYVRNEIISGEYKIQQLVAAAGHDTHKVTAAEEVYRALPPCCQYERASCN